MTAPSQPRRRGRRRFLLAAGLLLLAAGTASLALVAHTLWFRGAETRAAQEKLAEDLAAGQASPSSALAGDDDPLIHGAVTGGADQTTILIPTTTIPGLVVEQAPPRGTAVGRIRIPAAGVDWAVVEGVTLADLAGGPGHMPGTSLPGQPGNAVISGHRTTNGAPFFRLDALFPGNRITVDTLIGTHTYEVTEVLVVAPDAVWVTGRAKGAWLTLTTCHPPTRSTERLVVFARLIDGPNAAAIAAALEGEPTPPRSPGG